MLSLKKNRLLLISMVLSTLLIAGNAMAVCKNSIMNPVTDIDWSGVFPVKIGGITLISSDIDTAPDNMTSPVCECTNSSGVTFGFSVSFWEPARLTETVKDPYCFVTIGTQLTNPQAGYLNGNVQKKNMQNMQDISFQQAHWYIFPAWALLNLFTDMPCIEKSPFDPAYLTEVDPTWNSSLLAMWLNPEALLFANPIAQLADIPDSISTLANYPIDALFWVMGSWGSTYPLSGSITSGNYTEANAGMAARMIFKLGREGMLWDSGVDVCGAQLTPVWVKSNYRLQIDRPVQGDTPQPIGKSGLLWASGKNPPGGSQHNASDNYLWVVFRRVLCCIGVTI